jgi:RHS repeat-associated protein
LIALVLNLLIWPSSQLALRQLSVFASVSFGAASDSLSQVPQFFKRLFGSSAPKANQLTLAERTNLVSSMLISPHKYVGYVGDAVTFVAIGSDLNGEVVHGAKFGWTSSNEHSLTIDEAGRARLLRPGLVGVNCRAGSIQKTVPVLIKPTRRRLQTDFEWRQDQDSLNPSAIGPIGLNTVVPALLDSLAPTAYAQSNPWGDNPKAAGQIGTPPYAALEETRLGPVMPGYNFELPLPVVSLGGRGIATALHLYYNSSVWGAYFDPIRNTTVYAFDPIQSWPSPGFSLGFGRVTFYDYSYYDGVGFGYKYMFIAPNGTRHSLGIGTVTGNNILRATDGSHITYVGDVLGGTLYYNDGTAVTISKVNNRLLPTQITDTNGNYIQVAYKWETNFPPMAINYIVDTMGRVIQFHYDAYNSTGLTSISTPTGAVTLNYQTLTMNVNFQNEIIVENAPPNFSAITGVTIPGRPSYQFTYSGYGMIYNIVATSNGGTATVTYDYPLGGEELYSGPTFTQRTESPNAVYTYGSEITRPDGSKLILSNTLRELKNSLNQTLSKTAYAYTTDPGGSTAVQSVINTDETGQQTKIDFDYDAYGNVVNKREYGFKISGQWQVRRRTHYSYVTWEPYVSSYVRNRVTLVEVYDALGNTNDADDVMIGKTVYAYDNSMGGVESYGGAANPPGHLSSYDANKPARGNVTDITNYSDVVAGISITHGSKVDIFGNTTREQVDCCNEKSFIMTEATYWSRPSQTITGSTSGVYLTTSTGYDFNTLAATSETDPNNQTTTYGYDIYLNPTGFTSPTGASGVTNYNAWGQPLSSSVSYTEGGNNRTINQSAVYDGWGQLIQSVDAHGAQTNYTYNNMGRTITRSNPFPQGGTPGPVSSYQYDLLGRNTLVTLPGGNSLQTTYSSSVVTMTDQVNRKMKRETDGLGRLIKVTEQDPAGALTQVTNYTYDAADRLILVSQGNQTRAFKYDSLGRLLYERMSEQSATINDGTGTFWSAKYTYNAFAVATKTDARGVVTTYGYDALNRLALITYNTSQAPGVAATNNVTYTYDNSQASNTKGLLLSITMTGPLPTYTETTAYDSFKRVSSRTRIIDGLSYTTSYQYNTANQITQITYPASARVLNITHDNSGDLATLSDQFRTYVSGITHNVAGQVTGVTLGNGVSESYGYEANRMQLTSQTATAPGGPAGGLVNLTYSYQAAAGQSGVTTTAGNSDQLISVSGTINGTIENASYTYDLQRRLVTSSQTSNGVSAQRRSAHDRWGNRTAMWDATSGGNQIQSIMLAQSAGAPTNRIQSITTPGGTINYTYDAAGNVLNDGTHSYSYDAENRIASVDAGVTAQYSYDIQNRRVKKASGGATTHYVWEGFKVIAEHNGSNGAVNANYVYSGSRMVAKIMGITPQYFLSDKLSTRLILDTSGNVLGRQAHLPFGEEFAGSGTQEKHNFTTYESDVESATDYAINRQYAQGVGRFQSADPYTASGGAGEPQSWNRYSYVTNDPLHNTDPLGLFRVGISLPGGYVLDPCYLWDWPNFSSILYVGAVGCGGSVAYIPEDLDPLPDAEKKHPWRTAPVGQDINADFAATPRGVIKIPNFCRCEVICLGGADYKVVCQCEFVTSLFSAPRAIPESYWRDRAGKKKEVDDPRDPAYNEAFKWAYTQRNYGAPTTDTIDDGVLPTIRVYTFN